MRPVAQRGALIVLEGCDRSGKTTVCKRLINHLNDTHQLLKNDQKPAKMMRFPDRDTAIGQEINKYLKGTQELDDHVIHLLFAANRWELVKDMKKALEAGQNIIVDRYVERKLFLKSFSL